MNRHPVIAPVPAIEDGAPAMPTRRALLSGMAACTAVAVLPLSAVAAPLSRFAPAGGDGMDHSAFDRLLKRFVRPDGEGYNRVDYRAFKAARGELKAYLAVLERAAPSSFARGEAHAYWINLYNARTLDVVLDRYPVASIKKINLGGGGLFGGGPWSKPLMTVEGEALSLDDIEHRIVRPLFADPMSHYALNCASYSCPNLAVSAYTGRNLAALMAENARAYVNHPRGVTVSEGTITASKIYSWYGDDFGGRGRLKAHWKRFAEAGLGAAIDGARIGGFVYDWSLNDV